MPTSSDSNTLPASTVCDLAGVLRQTRDKWVKRKILASGSRLTVDDLVELAVFSLLSSQIGFEDARRAWLDVRSELAASIHEGRCILIVDLQRKRGELAVEQETALGSLAHGRPLRMYNLRKPVSQLQDDFAHAVLDPN